MQAQVRAPLQVLVLLLLLLQVQGKRSAIPPFA
jgi:hypothetical protein